MTTSRQHSTKQPRLEGGSARRDALGAAGSLTARDFFGPLMHVAILSYFLAIPLLALTVSIDIDFGGRWMCDPTPVSAFGTVHDRDGVPICRIEVDAVLLFWTLFGVIVSPVPIFGFYLRQHLRSISQLDSFADSAKRQRLSREFCINTGLCVLFAAILGRGWLLSFVILPGAALAIYIYRFWRTACQTNFQGEQTTGDELLASVAATPIMRAAPALGEGLIHYKTPEEDWPPEMLEDWRCPQQSKEKQ